MSALSFELIVAHAATTPARDAIVYPAPSGRGYRSMTYGELAARAAAIAAGLEELGIRRGDRVALLVPMSAELYVLLTAIAMVGAVAVFVEPASTPGEMARALEQADARALIGVPKAYALRLRFRAVAQIPLSILVGPAAIAALVGAVSLDEIERRGQGARVRPFDGDPEAPALLTFSSGTGGLPKGAVRSAAFLRAQHEALDELLQRQPGRVDVEMSAFAIVVMSSLAAGTTAVLPRLGRGGVHDVDGEALVRLVRERGVTVISGSPTFLAPLFGAARRAPLAGVRRVVSGGAPVPIGLCEEASRGVLPDGSFLVVYGSTEAEPISTIDAREVHDETAAATRRGRGLCVGRIAAGLELRILAPGAGTGPLAVGPAGLEGLCARRGAVGEIVVTGPHVNRRYFRNRDAERATKIVDERGEIWHRTGDAGYLDEQHRLWFVGRVADEVRRGATAYYPAAVEALAQTDPAVGRAALVAGPHEELLLAVEPAPAARVNRDGLRRRLAAEGVDVDGIRVLAELPTDPRHRAKLDYKAIRRRIR